MKITQIIIVKKESQKAIIIGKGGEKIKDVGTRARIDMEKFLKKSFSRFKGFKKNNFMQVIGKGYYLGGRSYGESSYISYILSKENGLIKVLQGSQEKNATHWRHLII